MPPDDIVQVAAGDTATIPLPPEKVFRSKEEQVRELLSGGPKPPQPTEESVQSQATAEEPAAFELKGLAEKLGVSLDELYRLKFRYADGESRTFGELKDSFKAVADLDKRSKSLREETGRLEADRLQAQREITALLQAMPPHFLTPQLLETARQQVGEYQARQAEALLRAMPEWSDQTSRTADFEKLEPLAKEYGFTESELGLAKSNLIDHRIIKVLRDYAKLKAELAAVKARPLPLKAAQAPLGGRPGAGLTAQEQGRLKAAIAGKQMSKTDAIKEILKRG